jgi:TolB-like protein/DNA-binding SARP family transcriptional activator/Tfp pilus assembly protein PilF
MRLQLLGRFAVARPEDGTSIQLPTRKTRGLLAYLGMSRDYAAGREELAALLWGGCSEQQARQSLRQALTLLRRELGSSPALGSDTMVVRLDPAQWSIDARDFETLARSAKAEDLARAAQLFAGEFLSGLNIEEETFEEWARGQRTRMQLAAAHLCETFAKQPDLVIDANQALTAVERLMALDPLREDWQRLAIALYARYRGKNEAFARASSFAGLLQRELGVVPEKETRAMLESLKRSEDALVVSMRSDGGIGATGASATEEISNHPSTLPPAKPATAVNSDLGRLRSKSRRYRLDGRIVAALGSALIAVAVAIFNLPPSHTVPGPVASSALSSQSDPWRSPPSTQEVHQPKGIVPIVVLPFASLGGTDDSLQLTADMLTDDLTNILSRVPSFRVISRQTAINYKGRAIDVGVIGSELHVRYVLEGSVRLQGGKLRVNVELTDPTTRLSVWSGRVERNGADRQGVRDEVVSRLARELQFEVLPIESLRLSKDFDADALAYRGWANLSQVSLSGYKQALALFNQALESDPQNLSAQTGVGAYHARMAAQALDSKRAEHRAKAQDILRRVLVRDPNSSQAHFYLGLALNLLPTLPEALEHFERAIEIDPSDASAHGQIGNGLIRSGRPAEGLEHVRYAMRLSPRDPIMPVWLEFAGNGELELNHYPEAIAMFERSIALNPGYPRSWAGLVAAHALAGESAEARSAAEKLKAFAPNLDSQALTQRFGRQDGSRLHDGLFLAFVAPPRAER